MYAQLTSAVPSPFLDKLRYLKREYNRMRKLSEFHSVKASIRNREALSPAQRVLFFPSDAGTLRGSLGDDAMMTAAITYGRDQNRHLEVHMLCQAHVAGQLARESGYVPIPLPSNPSFASGMQRILEEGKYDALLLLGADVMDGYYSLESVENMLIAADLAARAGIPTSFLGFSFNKAPRPELKRLYDTLHPAVALNLRDEISLERLRRFSPAKTRLVADTAFLLKPGSIDQDTSTWIDGQRLLGRTVLGFNAHPMLIREASADRVSQLISKSVEAITETSQRRDVSWVLIPHDYREGVGDAVCLEPIFERLEHQIPGKVLYFGGKHRATTLKALAGRLDGVVTARMHLAIASLGMGVPTLCLTYQDKFEGLYRHFELPKHLLLSPHNFLTKKNLAQELVAFANDLPQMRRQIEMRLPRVRNLAKLNLLNFSNVHSQNARAGVPSYA